MTNYVMLNEVQHRDLKVITEHAAKYGDKMMQAMTFPLEFRKVQSCYPILFQKDSDSGQFFPISLLGFEQRENLFLDENGWDAEYIPLMVQRHPFLIGFQEAGKDRKPVVSIDMDNPRVSKERGEALFLPHGGISPYLDQITQTLEMIHQAHPLSSEFIDALLLADLLEAFTLTVTLQDGSKNQLLGLYTLNEDKLRELDAETLGRLHAAGHLMPIFMVVASLSRLTNLIERKNARLKDAAD